MPLEIPRENVAEQPLDPAVVKPVRETRARVHDAVGSTVEFITSLTGSDPAR
jgi:hypothetical protein